MKQKIYSLFLGSILLLVSQVGICQIVNVENVRIPSDTVLGWTGNTDWGFNFFKDLNTGITFGNESSLQYETKKCVYLFKGAIELTRFNKVNYSNSGYAHLRHNFKLSDRWRLEEFTQIQYNQIMGIDMRYLAGIGPRYQVVKVPALHVYIAALPMYEYLRNEFIPTVLTEENNIRISTYLNFTLRISNVVSIVNTTYFQPLANNFSDFKTNSDTNLGIYLGEKISYSVGFHYTYNSRPIPFYPYDIYYVMNSLSMRL